MPTLWSRCRGLLRSPASRTDMQRFAETYVAALDKLSDPSAPLRVGALRTLELLGDSSPEHRQVIVDVFCAYLRLPGGGGDDAPVRQLVQQILHTHLRPTAAPERFWAGITLDLTAATLVDFDLSGCRVDGEFRANLASFYGATKLRGTVLGAAANCHGATFHGHVWMERAVFVGPCHFDAVTFQADAWFGEVTFARQVSFAAATFAGHAWFGRCEFRGMAELGDAVFHRSVGLRGATLHVRPGLAGTRFFGAARVSRRGERWNIAAPGWRVISDPDNESVGQLVRVESEAPAEPATAH